MAERKNAATPKQRAQRARKATEAELAAGRANLAKGRAKKEAARAAATAAAKAGEKPTTAGDRWAALLDGSLTVQDLDDDEIAKMKVRSVDGTFNGKGRSVPSHIAQAMQQEALKRATEKFRNAAPRAVDALIDIANDGDVKTADRIRALTLVLERSLGKVPDTVRIEAQDSWGKLLREASGEQIDRTLADDL